MKQNPKQATVAGLLGIFLGGVGAHSFYLGEKVKGIIHACLAGVAFLILLIAGVIVPASMSPLVLMFSGVAGILNFFCILAWLIAVGNGIWALVEAIIILVQGDAGLAARGIDTLTVPAEKTGKSAETKDKGAAKSTTKSAATKAAGSKAVAARPAKRKPMNPATKKKLILGLSIGGGVIVLAIIAIVVIAAVTHVDYGATYRAAKELDEKISDFYSSSDCADAYLKADSTYVDEDDYNDALDECKAMATELDELVNALGSTSGIKNDSELKVAYDKFVADYRKVIPDQATLDAGLATLKAVHQFMLAVDELDLDEAGEAEIQEACNYLINSGNAQLATVGQGVAPLLIDYVNTYRTWLDSSGYYNDEYDVYQAAEEALENYLDDNDVTKDELITFELDGAGDVYDAYSDLYDDIVSAYELHYDGKGGCSTSYDGTVYCD